MDKASRKELLSIISKQEEDLERYRTRFQDVVAAHKRLLKEKEALDLSLRVMSETSQNPITVNPADNDVSTKCKEENEVEPQQTQESDDDTVEQLRGQLKTLMNSISTLSEEKSRMEASFQADRKQARIEKEEKDRNIKHLQKQLEQANRVHQNEMENYKSKLIVERHQREKEHNDHGVMMRELQKLLAEERSAREAIETGAESVRKEWTQYRSAAELRERELSNTVESLRRKLKREKESATPLLSTLQEEIVAMKQQHSIALLKERERASKAEERASKLAAMHEERVANLEARLAELSHTVGSYDRLRQDDQVSIHKLKERLIQLEVERGAEKTDLDLEDLVDKFQHLKQSIEEANETAEKPINLKGIFKEWQENMSVESYASSNHNLCHQEYMQLKKEYDSYREQMAAVPLVVASYNSNGGEVEALRERVNQLTCELEQTSADHKLQMDQLKNELQKERALWKEKIASSEQELRSKISMFEDQLSKQRERSLALVQEKDQEIHSLKTSFHALIPSKSRKQSQSSENDEFEGEGRHMLHYAHEAARYQVDVAKLRRQSHRLETTLRDTQRTAAEERVHLSHRIAELTNQVDRLERCQSREGANLEYLKNVVLSYLCSSDLSCRAHMLNAIAAVLRFTDSELQRVRQTTCLSPPSIR